MESIGKVRPAALLLVIGALIVGMQNPVAAPLGFATPDVPGFTFDRDDSRCVALGICTSYDASSNNFLVAGVPISFFPLSGGSQLVGIPASLSINLLVDESGLASGDPTASPGFVLTRNINGGSQILLTGEILAFGFADPSGGTDFQFRFLVTGGSLQPDYAGSDIGVMLDMESLTGSLPFDGTFDANFNGGSKGLLGRIPSIPVLDF